MMFNEIDKFFSDRRKAIFAVGAVGFTALWMILWNLLPMQFYVIFFASRIGSNIQLALLNLVVLFPLFYVFTKLTRTDLSFCKAVLLNVLLVAAVEYVFSVFMFSDRFYICVIAYVIHSAVNIWTFGSADIRDGKIGKGMRAPAVSRESAIKKQPMISAIWAAVFSFSADTAGIALMYIVAHIYAY